MRNGITISAVFAENVSEVIFTVDVVKVVDVCLLHQLFDDRLEDSCVA